MLKTRRLHLVLTLVMLCLVFSVTSAEAKGEDDIVILKQASRAFSEIVKKTSSAVVYIKVEKKVSSDIHKFNDPFELFDDEFLERFFGHRRPDLRQKKRRQIGQGSGFIFTDDGYILTNNHVVGGADIITVKLKDGREFRAKIIGTDPKSDVAVIKIDEKHLPLIPLGNSDNLNVGEWVIAIGNPFGLLETVTVGVVSATGRSTVGIADYENFIQTDAAINPGNSGGPLLNLNGEAVGINTAIFSRSGGYMGIGFSIPINMAIEIKDQLVQTGKVVRGYLGILIQEVSKDIAETFGIDSVRGVLVAEVSPNSPAERGGIKQGDIIVELNGKKVEGINTFRNKIAMTQPGNYVSLGIYRNNKYFTETIMVGTLPESVETESRSEELTSKFGFSIQNLTSELAQRFGYELNEGVIVSRVEHESPAALAEIRPGNLIISVNRKKVKSVSEFNAIMKESVAKDTILLLIKSEGYSRYVVLKAD